MSELVRQFFPDAPDRCENCPALENAAQVLAFYTSVTSEVSTRDDNPANPLVSGDFYLESLLPDEERKRAELPGFLSRLTEEEYEAISEMARELYGNCQEGALDESATRTERQGIHVLHILALTQQCRSMSRIVAFIPPSYSEHTRKVTVL